MPKQVIVHAPFDVRLDEAPPPKHPLGEFEMVVRTEVSALSPGTETRIYTGLESKRFNYRSNSIPLGLQQCREDPGGRQEGTRLSRRSAHFYPHASPQRVRRCRKGCRKHSGNTNSNVPQSYDVIAPVPDNVSSEHAVFTHLFVLGFNALHRGQYRFGENVVVIRSGNRGTRRCLHGAGSGGSCRRYRQFPGTTGSRAQNGR